MVNSEQNKRDLEQQKEQLVTEMTERIESVSRENDNLKARRDELIREKVLLETLSKYVVISTIKHSTFS